MINSTPAWNDNRPGICEYLHSAIGGNVDACRTANTTGFSRTDGKTVPAVAHLWPRKAKNLNCAAVFKKAKAIINDDCN